MIDRNNRLLIESIKRDDAYVKICVECQGTYVTIKVDGRKFKHDVALALQQSIIDKERESRKVLINSQKKWK